MSGIPDQALDDRIAIVGRAGYGKTNAAKVMAERLLELGARVCILDPTDAWWGLRLKPDGTTPAFPVAIFGGEKGDLALNEHAGETVGAAIAGSSQSTIVSMADFAGENARRRFAEAFLRALYDRNREPLHLIVDEADTLAPQRPIAPLDVQVLARMQQIVRRGRIRGFTPWLVTQRPAVLSKDVLSQADILIAFNLTASQDRDAIGAWIEGQADKAQLKAIDAEMPKLARGTAVVWAPGRSILRKTDFPLSATFDSGRTPKRGEARPAARLQPIDVEGLRGKLATVEADTKANDPKALRAEIARLTAELAKRPAAEVPDHVIPDARAAGWREGRDAGATETRRMYGERIRAFTDAMRVASEALLAPMPKFEPVEPPLPAGAGVVHRQAPYVPGPPARQADRVADGISRPQQRILDALAWLLSINIASGDRPRVAWLADASPTSSAFANNLGALSTAGLIRYPRAGEVELTDAGRAAADHPASPPTNAALHASIAAKLPRPQWVIVERLIEVFPGALDRQTLAERAAASATSSAFANNLGALRSLGLIDYPDRGQVVALPVLFVE